MNVSMWFKALQTIPRITKEEWNKLDVISRWLIATRASVLIVRVEPTGPAPRTLSAPVALLAPGWFSMTTQQSHTPLTRAVPAVRAAT